MTALAPVLQAFCLQHDRNNTIRTRNLRLTAIHSLFSYAALDAPSTPT